ncbi:hypothetical protein [Lentzea sp. NBRC 102530]|uniref:hypothetical protein n=1 Tax=Lentzea sp. NBRC 102530 TaxID=3032201 RepID=UPI0024A32DE8|nr:hypothetical protein [Lentzea sp. NBRC 102530]GLY49823.1 hypothetical protein Lesp01_34790 [Lentzea sp. NBRC 102530]
MTTSMIKHRATFALSAVVALGAWAGACLLLIGAIDFGRDVTSRLPFHSAVFAAIALLFVVAVPMTLTAWLCARSSTWWRLAGASAGAMLIGWILVQLALIQTFSWLQPLMAVAGVVVLLSALSSGPRPPLHPRPGKAQIR